MTYNKWIEANVKGDGFGECREITTQMLEYFPELQQVRGHYMCPIWGRRGHWWLVTPNGEIVDPTAKQFPSGGLGEYLEWIDGTEEPTGKCANCGEFTFKGENFCNDACFQSWHADLMRPLW